MITSATTLGALLGSIGAGTLSDFIGRRPVLAIADVRFIGGAIGQAVSHTVWDMIGTRFLIGWGVGVAACVAPLYIQELSPTRLRGRMVVINVVAITLGQVIAYGIDAGFEETVVSLPRIVYLYSGLPEYIDANVARATSSLYSSLMLASKPSVNMCLAAQSSGSFPAA